jgi:hypothetical protein
MSREWKHLIIDVAASRLDRDATTRRLKALLRKPPQKRMRAD